MSSLEGLHDGDDRGSLDPVALPAADLEGGEPVAVDQQAHDALRIDPPLLGLTRLPQVVLTLSLEVERGHSCRHRASTLVAMT